MKRAVVVGGGISGAVAARQLADKNYEVHVFERRAVSGGNCSEHIQENGVRVQSYGPHLFHTGKANVFDYLKNFAEWRPYHHRVLGRIDNRLVPIPFNFTAIEALTPPREAECLKAVLQREYPPNTRIPAPDLLEHPKPEIRRLGRFVIEKVFLNYTAKQWGIPIERVERSVLGRVPIVVGYEDTYFQDPIQQMPVNGFSGLIDSLLNSAGITLFCNTSAQTRMALRDGRVEVEGTIFDGPVIYTGRIDELFGYRFGALPYRAVNFVFEDLCKDTYQPASVVNYPNEESFTRITEFKKITGQRLLGHTSVLREYPKDADEGSDACYPIENRENRDLYERYRRLSKKYPNLILCGRLATYRYYNMDQVVGNALDIVRGL